MRHRSVPLVSVIIANYNYGRFLRDCLDSVLAQSYPHIETIVVDDGSTDNSRDVLAAYKGKVEAVLQQNRGQAAALSAGFAASRGDIICLLDADDGWHPNKVQSIVDNFERNPHALWLRHKLELVGESLAPLHRTVPAFRGSAPVPPDPLLLLEGGLTAGTSLALRRALADRVFPLVITQDLAFDADDKVLLARIFEQRAPGYSLDEVLGYYRRHGGTRFSASDLPRLLRREADLAEALGIMLQEAPPTTTYKLRAVLVALEGARAWQQGRWDNYLAGLRAVTRLWRRPRLLLRQTLGLTLAFVAPRLWLAKLRSQALV